MKTIELEGELELIDLRDEEINGVNGGWFPIAITVAIIISAVNNFGDIRQGLVDGFNGTPRY